MNNESFTRIVNKKKPKKNKYLPLLFSFLFGGAIGLSSQGLIDLGKNVLKLETSDAYTFSSIVLVFIASILTMLSWYNDLGQIAGAGLFIPVTGFSNSIVSASIEGKNEGIVTGIGTRMFSLAGSVIMCATLSSITVVIIKYILILCGVKL